MMAEIDAPTPPAADPASEPPVATPDEHAGPVPPAAPRPRPAFLDALMRALGPIHT